MRTLSDDILSHTLTAFLEHDQNQTKAAEALGLNRTTFQHRLTMAANRGMDHRILAPGLPPGQGLSGLSTYYDAEGQPKGQWVKSKTERSVEEVAEVLVDAFQEIEGKALYVPKPRKLLTGEDRMTLYPIADLHLGMYAWADETGQDYDVDIASALLSESMNELVAASPPSDLGLILNLGDFFHADNSSNRTSRSNNALDVDTRFAKVLKTGVRLMVSAIQIALSKHQRVLVRNLQGNHDRHAALALSIALAAHFDGHDRVEVDDSPSPFFYHRFGSVMIGATHGDMAKIEDMPGIMAAQRPVDWGKSKFRYAYGGHWHRQRRKLDDEGHGAKVEVFQTLAPKDDWNNRMGFTGGRSMVAITHHKDKGEEFRLTKNVIEE